MRTETPDNGSIVNTGDAGQDQPPAGDAQSTGPSGSAFEHLAAELATTFVDVAAEAVDNHIEAALERVAQALALDRTAVVQRVDGHFQVTHEWTRPGFPQLPAAVKIPEEALPWLADKVLRRQEPMAATRLSDYPPEASAERLMGERTGVKANVILPLVVAGESVGAMTFADLRHEREWPAPTLDRFRLLAQIVTSALARKGADLALRRAHAFEALVAELSTTLAGILTEPVDGQIEATLRQIAEFLGADRATVLQGVPPGPLLRTHQWVREEGQRVRSPEASAGFPWTVERVFGARTPVVFTRLEELPPAAARDRETFERLGIKSGIIRPLIIDDRVIGALVFGTLDAPRRWPPEVVDRLGLVSQLVASTLGRHRADAELRAALTENERLRARLEAENRYLQTEVRQDHDVDDIVGRSAALRALLHKVDQVAATDVPVLLLGETGTGKELMARTIHARSGRGSRPLIAVNCAALPPPLIESELFGHERGAFTGATQMRPGRFELADGSTLFLDEIGDLDPALQAKLLRVLQDGEVQRLGGSRVQKVDVRIIAATNRDPDMALREGRLRPDLYYRLSVFPIVLPRLRDRREDIPLLVWHFIQSRQGRLSRRRITEVPPAVMGALVAYDWPGNVRELQNVIDRALILSPGPALQIEETLGPTRAAARPAPPSFAATLEDVARTHIIGVLEECQWVIEGPGQAADRLGLRPSTLRSRMRKLNVRRPRNA